MRPSQKIQALKEAIKGELDPVALVNLLNNLTFEYLNFDLSEFQSANQLAIARAQAVQYMPGLAKAYNHKGKYLYRKGRMQEALQAFKKAATIADSCGDSLGYGNALDHIAIAYFGLKNFRLAIENSHRAIDVYSKSGGQQKGLTASCFNNLGNVYASTGRPLKALRYYEQMLDVCKKIGHKRMMVIAMSNKALMLFQLNKPDQAILILQQCLEEYRELQHWFGEGQTLLNLGEFFLASQQLESAEYSFNQALDVFRKYPQPSLEASVYLGLGKLYLIRNQYNHALDNALLALKNLHFAQDESGKISVFLLIASIEAQQYHTIEAKDALNKGFDIMLQHQDWSLFSQWHRIFNSVYSRPDALKDSPAATLWNATAAFKGQKRA